LVARTGWRAYNSLHTSLFIGTDFVFPTASSDQLGDGKYQIGPGVAVAFPMARLHSLLYGIAQEFKSIGGDPGRPDISYAEFQVSINTILSETWWTELDSFTSVDWTRDGKNGMTLDGQIGHQFSSRWQAFVQGGAGLWGKDVGQAYGWQAVCGVRWMFLSEP
jgi:hypothetical protein